MLNDVHFSPKSTQLNGKPNTGHAHVGHGDANTDRVRNRLPTATRADVPEAIYGEPEDRGDSFNTTMSAAVVLIVVLVVVGLAWTVFL